MHVFQPVPTEFFEANPFQKIGKDWMLITAQSGSQVNTMTASWGGLGVMWGKDAAFIVVRDSRYTRELIDQSDCFSLSFLGKDYHSALKYLGAVSGRDEEKIKNARLNVNYHKNVPFIDEADMVMICKKMCKQPLTPDHFTLDTIDSAWYKDKDYHNLYIGEIIELLAK